MTEELISLGDFKSIELAITVENTTSRTKTGPEKGVILVEFLEQGIVLDVPKASCAQGHNLTIEIRRKDNPDAELVSVTGKVEKLKKNAQVDGEEAEFMRAEIGLVQFDEHEWQAFKDLFSNRQAEIEKFLAGARGY
jgi:hypothetical protein